MRKIGLCLLAAVAAVGALCACGSEEKRETTSYTVVATLSDDYTLTASVVCEYVNNTETPLSEVWFNLYPNAFRNGAEYSPVSKDRTAEAYPDGKSYSKLDISRVSVGGKEVATTVAGEDENVLIVAQNGTLEPGERSSIRIDYTLKLPKVKHRMGYTDKSVNLADFYPIACVYRGGGFVADPYYSTGDPFVSECANYSVTLTVPKKYECAHTGELKSKREDGDVTVYEFSAKNVRKFAAVLGEYQKMSGLAGKVIVNYMYYSDANPELSLNAAADAVKTFSDLFGEYPYKEYTVVQTGFLNGGMEYPQLSFVSDAYSGTARTDIIVHETAHQWWYGAVGNDEVRNAWLDEALAEYSTMMFYEHNEGYGNTFDGKRADALGAYILYCETYKAADGADTTMTRAVNEYADETEYSYMTYVKGALMLDDVRDTVGSSAFIASLKKYYADNKYSIAMPQNLIGAFESVTRRNIAPVFDAWLNGNVRLFSSN